LELLGTDPGIALLLEALEIPNLFPGSPACTVDGIFFEAASVCAKAIPDTKTKNSTNTILFMAIVIYNYKDTSRT
jgi:hypothetical protein